MFIGTFCGGVELHAVNAMLLKISIRFIPAPLFRWVLTEAFPVKPMLASLYIHQLNQMLIDKHMKTVVEHCYLLIKLA
jgi:hypothetical protein